jgi:RNA polymerase sigma-70 factor (sigma-E family)
MDQAPNHPGPSVSCRRVKPDPHEEFAAFARASQPRLLRAAYLICGDAHLAQDLLQSALAKVAMRWSRLRDGQPEAYVRTVLYRDAATWWRRHRREITVARPPERLANDASDGVPLRLVLARALARLTPKQRAVLVLRFFEDHTEARTAQVLGVSIGTVKSQTAVALRRLRELAPELSDLDELRGARGVDEGVRK